MHICILDRSNEYALHCPLLSVQRSRRLSAAGQLEQYYRPLSAKV